MPAQTPEGFERFVQEMTEPSCPSGGSTFCASFIRADPPSSVSVLIWPLTEFPSVFPLGAVQVVDGREMVVSSEPGIGPNGQTVATTVAYLEHGQIVKLHGYFELDAAVLEIINGIRVVSEAEWAEWAELADLVAGWEVG